MMWNDEELGTVVDALRGAFPPGWELATHDLLLTVRPPGGPAAIWVVECKRFAGPQQVDGAIARLRRSPEHPGLIVAPFLSAESRRRIVAAGLSYADATGNVRLVHADPAVFVATAGADRDPGREPRPLRSLKGDGAGRVVRALADFAPPYGVRELASRAALPTGTTARVIALLARDGLLRRDAGGRILEADWAAILRQWAGDRGERPPRMAHYLEPRGLEALLPKLAAYDGAYAVGGTLAAARYEPALPAHLATVHAADPGGLAAALGLRRVEAKGNIRLVEARGSAPMERATRHDGVWYAAPSQAAADLLIGPGREPAEAELLMAWMEVHPGAWRA